MNIDLLKQVAFLAVAGGVITTTLVQIIKTGLEIGNKKILLAVNFGISMIIGTLFTIFFSDLTIAYALWSGLFMFCDADIIYKALEDKIFKSYKELGVSDEANSAQTDATKITFEKVGE